MYKVIKVMKEDIETHKFCDVCGAEIEMGMISAVLGCQMCGIDLCIKCIHKEKDWNNNTVFYCEKCVEVSKDYISRLIKLQNDIVDLEHTKRELLMIWKDSCRL